MTFSCDIDDAPEFASTSIHIAAKEHICCECRCTIMPGEEYEATTGKWEGEMATFKTCGNCLDLRAGYTELGYCFTYGDMWSDHREELEAKGVPDDHPAMRRADAMLAEISARSEAMAKARMAPFPEAEA